MVSIKEKLIEKINNIFKREEKAIEKERQDR
jgi:hypothetical protein